MEHSFNTIDENDSSLENIFSIKEAMELVDDDKELFTDIASIFISETPTQLNDLKESIMEMDSQKISSTAHALKGSIGNFGKKTAYEAVYKIEIMGRDNKLDGIDNVFNELIAELDKLEKVLQQYAA